MTHPESAIAALFDHEQEQPGRRTRGRERPAPDWGGDELFSSTPRRRRRAHDLGERHLSLVPAHDDWAPPRAWSDHDAATAVLDLPVPEDKPVDLSVADAPAAVEAASSSVEAVEFREMPAPAGRRTVTVTGHPEARITRTRRPAPTVDQRIGHRPDRIAMWAFALGMLLILIAILTANAG